MTIAGQRVGGVAVEHGHVRVGDADVMVHRAGAGVGEAVVFLHGSGPGATGWSNWQFALPALGDRFDCIAPDYCGFGDTTHPVDPPRDSRVWMRWRVEQVLGLLDVLGVERAHVVGNSMGGGLTLKLVTEAPERFERVVLMGTAGIPYGPPSVELQHMMSFYDDPTPEALARLYSYFIFDTDGLDQELGAIVEDRLAVALRPEVRRSFEAIFASGPLYPVVAETSVRRIEHPVLLVHGQNDTIVPVEVSHTLMSQLADARMYVFGRCGHWTQIEHPDRFNNLLAAFLSGDI